MDPLNLVMNELFVNLVKDALDEPTSGAAEVDYSWDLSGVSHGFMVKFP